VKVPLACLDNGALDFGAINTPFLVYTEGPFEAAFATSGGCRGRRTARTRSRQRPAVAAGGAPAPAGAPRLG
jgi:hypothetical protein